MAWVPLAAWLAGLVLAIVVLGFCAYEIVWKARRLRADVSRLLSLGGQLGDLQARLVETQSRIARAGLR